MTTEEAINLIQASDKYSNISLVKQVTFLHCIFFLSVCSYSIATQVHERARQGRLRAKFMKDIR